MSQERGERIFFAHRLAVKYIQDKMTIGAEELGGDTLINAAKTSMASKVIGMCVSIDRSD